MAFSPQTGQWRRIVAAIQKRVCDAVEVEPGSTARLDPQYVRVVASDGYKIDAREPFFVYLRYYGPRPFTDGGAGRRARRVSRLVRVYVYTRSNIDFHGSDEGALLGEVVGHSDREEQVLDALEHHAVADATGLLVIEPLHWVDSAGGPPEREPENEDGLVRSHLDFEVEYLARISLTDPPA